MSAWAKVGNVEIAIEIAMEIACTPPAPVAEPEALGKLAAGDLRLDE
ncbi:hypothetical protein [Acrocarpospora sp. B8E8]